MVQPARQKDLLHPVEVGECQYSEAELNFFNQQVPCCLCYIAIAESPTEPTIHSLVDSLDEAFPFLAMLVSRLRNTLTMF